MADHLKHELQKSELDDAIITYCTDLLQDETLSASEKHEAILGYLEAVTSEAGLSSTIKEAIAITDSARLLQAQESEARAKQRLQAALEQEKHELQRDIGAKPSRPANAMGAEERRRRDRLLMKYGFEVDEIVENENGEAEIVYREKKSDGGGDLGFAANDNAKVAADKERMVRESSRAEHQKKAEREKELREREKLKKEKEKRRTMKKEKRRM